MFVSATPKFKTIKNSHFFQYLKLVYIVFDCFSHRLIISTGTRLIFKTTMKNSIDDARRLCLGQTFIPLSAIIKLFIGRLIPQISFWNVIIVVIFKRASLFREILAVSLDSAKSVLALFLGRLRRLAIAPCLYSLWYSSFSVTDLPWNQVYQECSVFWAVRWSRWYYPWAAFCHSYTSWPNRAR